MGIQARDGGSSGLGRNVQMERDGHTRNTARRGFAGGAEYWVHGEGDEGREGQGRLLDLSNWVDDEPLTEMGRLRECARLENVSPKFLLTDKGFLFLLSFRWLSEPSAMRTQL